MMDRPRALAVTSRAYHTERLGPFLERLVELAGLDMALPMNTGAEAVETAIKAARKWGYRSRGCRRIAPRSSSRDDNFHGRTTTIVGFSSEPHPTATASGPSRPVSCGAVRRRRGA